MGLYNCIYRYRIAFQGSTHTLNDLQHIDMPIGQFKTQTTQHLNVTDFINMLSCMVVCHLSYMRLSFICAL